MSKLKSMMFETSINDDETLTFKISTSTPDRDSDILVPTGMKYKDYKNNPIVQYGHNANVLPIGKTTKITIYEDYIEADVLFASTQFANEVKCLCKEGFLNCASVGFVGIKSEDIPDTNYGKKYLEWDLLEWSIVNIPANPTATMIRQAKQKGLNIDTFEKEVAKMLIVDMVEKEKSIETETETEIVEVVENIVEIIEDAKTVEEKAIENIETKRGAVISNNTKMKIKAIYDEMGTHHESLKGCREKLKEFMMDDGCEGEDMEEGKSFKIDEAKENQIINDYKALDEKMNQVISMLQTKNVSETTETDTKNVSEVTESENEKSNDDTEDEIDLDSIQLPETEKNADLDEINFEPEQLKQLIQEQVMQAINNAKGGF